jgi:hypothetical protein
MPAIVGELKCLFFDKTREGESRKEYDALIARKKAMRV